MKEMDLLNEIRLALQDMGVKTFRINVGVGKTQDGRYFNTGVPKGFSDLFCVRNDGKAVFIECKVKPNKPTKEQCNFILAMVNQGCPSGVAFSVADAINIAKWDDEYAEESIRQTNAFLERYKK